MISLDNLFEMVYIFKTDVQYRHEADRITQALSRTYPGHQFNFDLEDCDKILRMKGAKIKTALIINNLEILGYICIELH